MEQSVLYLINVLLYCFDSATWSFLCPILDRAAGYKRKDQFNRVLILLPLLRENEMLVSNYDVL